MSLLAEFIDLLYPRRCLVCSAFTHAEFLCRSCLDGFTRITSPHCPICGRPFRAGAEEDRVCEECLRKRPLFEKTVAPYTYEGEMMRAIHEFKYEGKAHMARALGPLLASFAEPWLRGKNGLVLIPVPLHPRRLRERGFNQSLQLARQMAARLNCPVDFLSLRRTKDTKPQTGLKSEERRRNVGRAFEVLDRKAVKGKRAVLVDDVATTGSTLNECARVLRRAGCKEVYGVVLARTALG